MIYIHSICIILYWIYTVVILLGGLGANALQGVLVLWFCLASDWICFNGAFLLWKVGKNLISIYWGALTHWGRAKHICVGKLTIIGSDNGLPPGRRQAIIWSNAGILLIGPLGTNFSEILIGIQTFSFKKMHLKMSSVKGRLFSLGLNELIKYNTSNRCNTVFHNVISKQITWLPFNHAVTNQPMWNQN